MAWLKALRLETEVAQIIHQQEINGVKFALDRAIQHINTLEERKQELYNEVRPYLKYEVVRTHPRPVEKPFKKNGDMSVICQKWFEGVKGQEVVGQFSRVRFDEPDLGSRQKLVAQLLAFGWEPEFFTEKGFPKLTEKGEPVPSIFRIKAPIGKQIAEWYVLSHRQSQIQGWIDRIRPDGRLTAGANSCGTNTARMRHKTVVNVPKASEKVVFGYEMRDLFITDRGYTMCGHDASGLEARMMGHYTTPLDDGVFANELLNGDVHSKNAKIFFKEEVGHKNRGDDGFEPYRDLAKTLFYALIYGAQATKVASIIGCNTKRAQEIIDEFWYQNGGLGKLRQKVMDMADRWGYVPGLDGRRIYIRSSHSALNALFQSGGAITMKVAMVILDHWAKKAELEYKKVIDMHDESQAEIPNSQIILVSGESEDDFVAFDEEYAGFITTPAMQRHDGGYAKGYTKYGELAVKSVRKAGEHLKLRCALDAEYKLGRSWAETH